MEFELKPIPNVNGYFVGTDGNIYCDRVRGRYRIIDPLRMRLVRSHLQSNKKYLKVIIRVDYRKPVSFRVHRLICLAFHGFPIDKQQASHLDGNAFNNKPENLKWENPKENRNRRFVHGTHDRGLNNSRAKINVVQLSEIRLLLAQGELTDTAIGKRFGLLRAFVTKIKLGYRYKEVVL